MAVITLDRDNDSISILVEKSDIIHDKEDNVMVVGCGSKYSSGKVFVNGEIHLCMMRGERG